MSRAASSTGVMVALLRGVNVGGRSKLAMSDLVQIASDCGYGGARTYIQSGNLVFIAPAGTAAPTVAEELQGAIAERTSVRPAVVVRTREELAAAVDANLFSARDLDAVHVLFGAGTEHASIAGIDLAGYAPEEAATVGRETYLFLPGGVGRSRLVTDLSKGLGRTGTMRNWRTVTKVLAMADELA